MPSSDGRRTRSRAKPKLTIYEQVVFAALVFRNLGPKVGVTEPRLFTKPLRELTPETSHGFSVIEFASDVLGIWLYPWQRALLIRALELNVDGTYRFRKIFVLVGRQNGKTTLLTVLTLWWLFMDADSFPEHLPASEFLILGTAQNLDLAEEAWDSALRRCDPNPEEDDVQYVIDDLAAETRRPVKTNGKKSLRLRNGAKYEPRAASRMGGRGKSAARVVMDEMREQQTWDVWGSVSKTKNAIYNSQLWGISSAGDAKSIVLQTLRDGLIKSIKDWDAYVETGVQSAEEFANSHDIASALFEWSAEEKKPLLDIDGILQSNPSVGYKPMFFESIWSDLLGDEPEATKRTEILCVWVTSLVPPYMDAAKWADGKDAPEINDRGEITHIGSTVADGSRIVMGIDTSGDRGKTYVGIAGYRDDELIHVELIKQDRGMLWVVEYAKSVRELNGVDTVAIQARGCPAADLIEPLREAGFTVVEIGGTVLLNSAGRLKDRVRDGLVRHRSQQPLNLAIESGTTRDLGGMAVWDRYGSVVDVAPAVAISNALSALETVAEDKPDDIPPPPPQAELVTRTDVSSSDVNLATAQF